MMRLRCKIDTPYLYERIVGGHVSDEGLIGYYADADEIIQYHVIGGLIVGYVIKTKEPDEK